ncbi:serine protease persephone-like isoform X2 [Phymastichus coffea]|uniref:serine protease persephone-like isoform X2 n=1 Tax=Phymastichus coffea TaxID=108790 RepID=UPI00273A891A|nr:serine protease persephone-like isoform X2 [Phymastichus coffea]
MHGWALVLLALFASVGARMDLYEGNRCQMEDGSDGKCIKLPDCPLRVREVKAGLRFSNSPGRCGFVGFIEIVCCPLSEVEGKPVPPSPTSPATLPRITTTLAAPTVAPTPLWTLPDPRTDPPDGPFDDPFINTQDIVSKLSRRPADAACFMITRGITNTSESNQEKVNPWIFDGVNATHGEFPHMVALGFQVKSNPSALEYSCGGTLITLQYILTAAHCVINNHNKKPSEAKLGATDLTDTSDSVQNIKISKLIHHPKYKQSLMYHDIAILKLERPAVMTKYVKPICLQTKPIPNLSTLVNATSLIVTGWGATSFEIGSSNILQKTPSMQLIERLECTKFYENSSKLPRGIDDSLICLTDEDKTRRSDSCQGDSGGPLIIGSDGTGSIIGVVSAGQSCGSLVPAVYTSVYFHIDWIEEVIWSDQRRSLRRI